jgi:gamma-glutamyl hercynylcysteine S-oxide synthase
VNILFEPFDRARQYSAPELRDALADARRRLLAQIDTLSDAQWRVPFRPGLNPIAWEAAHVAWFAEFWILRGPHRVGEDGFVYAARRPVHAGPDELFDSSRLAHADRWQVALPGRDALRERLAAQLDACRAALTAASEDDDALYFHRLALFHEDMHNEAFTWLRATLGYPSPDDASLPRLTPCPPVQVSGATVIVGSPRGAPGFAFDNEAPAYTTEIADFEIDSVPVTAGAFERFVNAGGYDSVDFWPGEAGRWRAACGRAHPERWRRGAQGWETRWFDRWLPLDAEQAVIHVNAYEAEAYCRWAGRRLPRAAEWEHAACTGAIAWGGSVWEWTADPFLPYPGFVAGAYRDYSMPWFGTHRELRGGAFAAHARMHYPRYRNFFTPDRCDVFTGFRTVANR